MIVTFWLVLTIVALVWYGLVTIYVAIRGAGDIRNMLAHLQRLREQDMGSSKHRP